MFPQNLYMTCILKQTCINACLQYHVFNQHNKMLHVSLGDCMSRVTARQHENTQEKYGQGGVDAESRTTSAVGLRLSERQAKFFNAHFMRDGKRTTAGDLFRDWYPHAACAEAGLRSSKYDLQVLSSLKEAILVVCQDPAAIHSATRH